jgi:IS30 family transposase
MAHTVTDATIELLKPFNRAVLTITADNGKEFADPYCSWQRGLNENTNDLLRRIGLRKRTLKKYLQEK